MELPVQTYVIASKQKSEGRLVPEFTIERRGYVGEDIWCIKAFGECMRFDGTLESEPQSSSRNDDFIARTRFSLEEAIALAKEHMPDLIKQMGPYGQDIVRHV